jgi:pimeloyl-ACP methyl ester carboxylesterase
MRSLANLKRLERPSWLPASTWPFDTKRLELDNSLIAVSEMGEGPVLFFVHVGTWSFIWRDLVTRLASGFRCVFFDAPGTGQSQNSAADIATLRNAARATGAVIDALDLKEFTLVVHDLGGPAAFAAVAATPECVQGIVAMNSFGWRPSGVSLRSMLAMVGSPIMREFDVLTGLLPRITSSSFGVGRGLDSSSRAAFRGGMGPRNLRSFHRYMNDALHCDDVYARAGAVLSGPLATVPLLTIFGERNDPFGFQKRWKELFPAARQVVVPKGNHFPMCDAPDFVAHTIRSWHAAWNIPENSATLGISGPEGR